MTDAISWAYEQEEKRQNKDKTFKVKYHTTDTGCLMVWVYHGDVLLSLETVFPDNRLWFESKTTPECQSLLPAKKTEGN